MKGGPPPPPPAPGIDQVTAGLFVLHEEPVGPATMMGQRRMLMWDVAPRELQLCRGSIDPRVERRIAGREVARVHLEDGGSGSRVQIELRSGERVDLIGTRRLDEATATAELVAKVTGAELVRS